MSDLQPDQLRILVADDEPSILDLYKNVLSPDKAVDKQFSDIDELAGKLFGKKENKKTSETTFDTVFCRQGDEALEAVKASLKENKPFSVAFLDVRMPPGPDGIWVAQQIRKLDSNIEFVVVTGYSDVQPEEIAARVQPAQKLLYIQKPFHPQEITQFASALGSKWWMEGELLKFNKELESQVKERTADLEKRNEHLSQEIEIRKRVEAELKDTKELAEKANLTKSVFLANMSHELRTPLNHIMGFTELVLDKNFGELNDTQEEYLGDVLNSSKHLLSLINDILDLSKIEAGKVELESAPFNLKILLENSFTMIKEKAMKHGITLLMEIDGIPDTITADERMLKQIIYNLLSNAVKFTPDGGKIRLLSSLANNKKIIDQIESIPCQLSAADFGFHQDWVQISVQDTGIGFKPEEAERIFHPFEQLDSSKSRRYQGTGLGLSLTKQFTELHDGSIWAESEGEGKGSTFHIVIPIE
jgi:signal transduction histidine kinase